MPRFLVPTAAALWGLQIAFLAPALALILVSLYGATTAEVGWVLGIYNAGGFVASLLIPGLADRRRSYLLPMLGCGVLTLLLVVALGLATDLPWATAALVVLGGPAGVGTSLLFAHLRQSGATPSQIVNTRAIISAAWVAGPPLATVIIGFSGGRGILLAVGIVAVLAIAAVAGLAAVERSRRLRGEQPPPAPETDPGPRTVTVLVVVAFVLLQAANATVTSILTVYVATTLGLPVWWGGIALGVAAALEVPALVIIGRLADRGAPYGLLITGCLAGIVYYAGMAVVSGPVALIGLQVLNAWSFAAIAGVGLPLFQQLIPRPGLATGLFMNTRRIGAVVSGPLIALGSLTVLGDRGIFVGCAVLTLLGIGTVLVSARLAGVSLFRRD